MRAWLGTFGALAAWLGHAGVDRGAIAGRGDAAIGGASRIDPGGVGDQASLEGFERGLALRRAEFEVGDVRDASLVFLAVEDVDMAVRMGQAHLQA